MANEERKREDLYIKEKRRSKKFFITGSNISGFANKTTVTSSLYTEMSKSFADGEHLTDPFIFEPNKAILFMLQNVQDDLEDVYNEVSASSFKASFFPFATIDSGSFGVISSSLIPNTDDKYDLGQSGKEWNDLYIDGTAHIDSLAMGTTVTKILDEDNMSSDSATSLATQQSIKKYVDDNGGGTVDKTLSNSSTNAVRNSAVHAGLATKQATIDASNRLDASLIGANGNVSNTEYGYLASVSSDIQTQLNAKLSLAGGTMKGLIEPIVTGVKSVNKGRIDARATNVFEFNIKLGATVDSMISSFVGQEVTILNLGQGAITITHTAKLAPDSFFIAGGKNLTIPTATAYKFIMTNNRQWLLIQ